MSDLGLKVFDTTVRETHNWLNDIGESLGADKQRQYQALRAVLFALRDRMTVDEAFHLSAQLPMLVRGVFWEGYDPTGKPQSYRDRDAFLGQVSAWLETSPPLDPEDGARAVFQALARNIEPGQLEQVRHMMPEPVRELFPEG